MGATDPAKAEAGTLRKDFGSSIEHNATHGSDAPETAAFELGYFFRGMELHLSGRAEGWKGDRANGQSLIIVGLLIAAVGLLMTLGVPIGRLPGDFTIRRGNFSFYFPLATSILASIVLTLVMMFSSRRR